MTKETYIVGSAQSCDEYCEKHKVSYKRIQYTKEIPRPSIKRDVTVIILLDAREDLKIDILNRRGINIQYENK